MSKVGENIKRIRQEKGLTQEQLEYMADSVLEAVAEMQAGK